MRQRSDQYQPFDVATHARLYRCVTGFIPPAFPRGSEPVVQRLNDRFPCLLTLVVDLGRNLDLTPHFSLQGPFAYSELRVWNRKLARGLSQ